MARTNSSPADIAQRLRDARSIAVLAHYRPDGDAIGTTLAFALSLRALGKEVHVLNEDGCPENLAFLPGSDLVRQPQPGEKLDVDIALAVDCATRERLGDGCLAALAGARTWMNIDHHRSNPGYGDIHFIDDGAPAAGEIAYEILSSQGMPMNADIAANIYVAISTDTGSFQYQGTTPRTYEIAAALIREGIDLPVLARQTYENYPLRRVELLRGLLNTMQITHEGRVASWSLTRELADQTGMQPEDSEGLIDNLRSIRGVIVAAAFEELPGADGKIRISLRSKDPAVDVGAVCAAFGGGGHTLAAGARLRGPISEAMERVSDEIGRALKNAGV